ncbi:hypothetical protein ACHAXN_008378, partial [Cyclotella atomus]
MGRSKTTGSVTYINHSVCDLTDILSLKRRAVGDGPTAGGVPTFTPSFSARVDSQDGRNLGLGQREQRRIELNVNHLPSSDLHVSKKDIASAITSGRMHACETNHESDDKYPTTSQTAGVGTIVTSSKSVSAVTLGTKSRSSHVRGAPKKKPFAKKDDRGSAAKLFKIFISSRKIRSKIARLLKANNIVPFIHLPVRLLTSEFLREAMLYELEFQGGQDSAAAAAAAA